MRTTDSIGPSVKDFFFLIQCIDRRSKYNCQTDDHRYISSHSTDGIDPSVKKFILFPPFILIKEKPVNILQE
jgi:hypothetical protein